MSGGTLSENGPLGNITVSVVLIPSIRDMTALRAAIANGGTVMIDGHIGNSDNAETLLIEDLGGDLVLDLGGHTLNAAIVVNDLSDSGYKVTIKNGTLAGNTRDASSYTVENKSGNVFIADCTVARGGGYVTVKNEGKMTMIDCTVLYYDGRDGVAVAAGADSELELRGETDFSGDEGVSIGNINAADGSKVAASPGTYNFDPTQYVDTELYTVTESGGRWTVAERT